MIPRANAEPGLFPRTVLWTRGDGCQELAELLAGDRAIKLVGDPHEAAIRHRADMVVMKKVGSLDLAPVAAPTDFDAARATHVVAAVGAGPHSRLAAVIAGRLGAGLGVTAEAIMAVRPGSPQDDARRTLGQVMVDSGVAGRVVEAESEAGLLESVSPASVLVLGASGGSWLHRQFFGPGAKLRTRAPAGTIVVRDTARRAFHLMTEPAGVSGHLRVADAMAIVTAAVTPVVEEGHLVGVVRKQALAEASVDAEVAGVMETPAFVEATDELDEIAHIVDFYEGAPIPLVDRRGRLVGLLDPTDLAGG